MMSNSSQNTIGLSDLIDRVKEDLFAKKQSAHPDIFRIQELTIELNFVIDGNIESGFNLGIVTLGSEVSEERVQKVTVKLVPIVSDGQLIEKYNENPQKASATIDTSTEVIFRGDLPRSGI